jgi:hypothetical protein
MMDECEKCTITKPRKTGVTETVEEGERERERERERTRIGSFYDQSSTRLFKIILCTSNTGEN